MSKDFKAKYFEKAKELKDDSLSDYSLSDYDLGFNDGYQCGYYKLFPYINEMRDALEKYKSWCETMVDDGVLDETLIFEYHNGNRALKNLDDFVGGGEQR